MASLIGEIIGPYQIVEQIDEGGVATKYKAYQVSNDRDVAIKLIRSHFVTEPGFMERFQRQAQILCRLEHENIISVYDFAEHKGQPYLVMQHIVGEPLDLRLKAASLNQDEIWHIIKSIGRALSYAHTQEVLHLDIKPSNVVMSADGRVYLDDLGLTCIVSSKDRLGYSGGLPLATPQYVSPEIVQGRKSIDAGSDIYSFGILIYELLVGQVPFSAWTPMAVFYMHANEPVPPPRTRNPEIPERVERVLLKALAKNREDRFVDVASFVDALEGALERTSSPGLENVQQTSLSTGDKSRIFISYSRRDTDFMRRLKSDLQSLGFYVWTDEADLEPGTPVWESAIAGAIEKAHFVVALLSPDAKQSNWVARELSFAEDHNLRIFPVLIRGERKSSVPFRLTSTQTIDASRDYSAALKELTAALERQAAKIEDLP